MSKEKIKTSASKLATNQEYLKQLDDIKIRVPKGYRDVIRRYAESQGISVNQLVIRAIEADAMAHGTKLEVPSGIRDLKKQDIER